MVMNCLGRKKAASASKEKNVQKCDHDEISCKCNNHHHDHDHKHDHNHHDYCNETADYGIILVKKYTKIRDTAMWRRAMNDPNHRGVRPKTVVIEKEESEGIVDRLMAVFCGACISEKYNPSTDLDLSGTTVSGDSSAGSESDDEDKNVILMQQDRFQQEQQDKEERKDLKDLSLLTDVSMLTDGSPIDNYGDCSVNA